MRQRRNGPPRPRGIAHGRVPPRPDHVALPKPKPPVAWRRLSSPDPRRLRDDWRRQARTSKAIRFPAPPPLSSPLACSIAPLIATPGLRFAPSSRGRFPGASTLFPEVFGPREGALHNVSKNFARAAAVEQRDGRLAGGGRQEPEGTKQLRREYHPGRVLALGSRRGRWPEVFPILTNERYWPRSSAAFLADPSRRLRCTPALEAPAATPPFIVFIIWAPPPARTHARTRLGS